MIKDHADLKASAVFIKAAQLAKEGKAVEASKLLQANVTRESELDIKLACVQLLLNQGERKEAIAIFNSLNEKDRSLPGIVGALVTLHMADNNREKAALVLKDAVNYYKKNKVCKFFFSMFNKLKIESNLLTKKNSFIGNHWQSGQFVETSCRLSLAQRRSCRCRGQFGGDVGTVAKRHQDSGTIGSGLCTIRPGQGANIVEEAAVVAKIVGEHRRRRTGEQQLGDWNESGEEKDRTVAWVRRSS